MRAKFIRFHLHQRGTGVRERTMLKNDKIKMEGHINVMLQSGGREALDSGNKRSGHPEDSLSLAIRQILLAVPLLLSSLLSVEGKLI